MPEDDNDASTTAAVSKDNTENSATSSSNTLTLDAGSKEDEREPTDNFVRMEPLSLMKELRRHVLCTHPVNDDKYLEWCCDLVGRKIWIGGEEGLVTNFEILPQLKVCMHTVSYRGPTKSGVEEKCVLAVRDDVEVEEGEPDNRTLWIEGGNNSNDFLGLNVLIKKMNILVPTAERFVDVCQVLCTFAEAGRCAKQKINNQDLRSAIGREVLTKCGFTITGEGDEATMEAENLHDSLKFVLTDLTQHDKLANSCPSSPRVEAAAAANEHTADPDEPVHTVYIIISEDFPLEICWPLVRDDIVRAVRELPSGKRGWPKGGWPRGFTQMDEAVRAGVAENSCGPVARGCTLRQAESLVARLSGTVSAGIMIDRTVVEELNAATTGGRAAKSAPSSGPAVCLLGTRLQFNNKKKNATGNSWIDNWQMGVLVGRAAPKGTNAEDENNLRFAVIDENGVMFENLPVAQIRMPKGRRRRSKVGGAPYSFTNLLRQAERLWTHQEGGPSGGGSGGSAPALIVQNSSGPGGASGEQPVRQFIIQGDPNDPSFLQSIGGSMGGGSDSMGNAWLEVSGDDDQRLMQVLGLGGGAGGASQLMSTSDGGVVQVELVDGDDDDDDIDDDDDDDEDEMNFDDDDDDDDGEGLDDDDEDDDDGYDDAIDGGFFLDEEGMFDDDGIPTGILQAAAGVTTTATATDAAANVAESTGLSNDPPQRSQNELTAVIEDSGNASASASASAAATQATAGDPAPAPAAAATTAVAEGTDGSTDELMNAVPVSGWTEAQSAVRFFKLSAQLNISNRQEISMNLIFI